MKPVNYDQIMIGITVGTAVRSSATNTVEKERLVMIRLNDSSSLI